MSTGYGRYSQAYQKSAVTTVDQGKLIVMMYDGAIKFLTQATDRIEKGQTYEAHASLIKGKSIVAELMGSLDMEKGGDIAHNLQRLYAFMFGELIEANLTKSVPRVEKVITLLKELREGWKAIAVGGQNQPPGGQNQAPGKGPSGGGQTKNINLHG